VPVGLLALALAVAPGVAADPRAADTGAWRIAETADPVDDTDARDDAARMEPLFGSCDPVARERLHFLEERLDDNETYAERWWWAWNGVYVIGMGFQGTRAGFEDKRGKRADLIASASKAAIGLARNLWAPPIAKLGTDDLPELDGGCDRRVQAAEARLREAAEEGQKNRWSWKPHAANLALNLSAGILVAELYEYDFAYVNAGIGIAMGELRIFTFPQAHHDVDDYERRFASGLPKPPETTWRIGPWHQGARLVVNF
jgi:hypothetical protein